MRSSFCPSNLHNKSLAQGVGSADDPEHGDPTAMGTLRTSASECSRGSSMRMMIHRTPSCTVWSLFYKGGKLRHREGI